MSIVFLLGMVNLVMKQEWCRSQDDAHSSKRFYALAGFLARGSSNTLGKCEVLGRGAGEVAFFARPSSEQKLARNRCPVAFFQRW